MLRKALTEGGQVYLETLLSVSGPSALVSARFVVASFERRGEFEFVYPDAEITLNKDKKKDK